MMIPFGKTKLYPAKVPWEAPMIRFPPKMSPCNAGPRASRDDSYVGYYNLWGARGPPEAPCAAQQCGNGAPALPHTRSYNRLPE